LQQLFNIVSSPPNRVIVVGSAMSRKAQKPPTSGLGRGQRASATAAAGFVEPMLLLRTDLLPPGEQWLYELKLDGYRAIGFKRNRDVCLRSRNDNDFKDIRRS